MYFVCNSFVVIWNSYMIIWKLTKQLRLTFFFIIYKCFHTAKQLYRHSHTSRTITSSQHHPRETRPFLCQSSLYKNCYIGIVYYEFASYITDKYVNLLVYCIFHSRTSSHHHHIEYELASIDSHIRFFIQLFDFNNFI